MKKETPEHIDQLFSENQDGFERMPAAAAWDKLEDRLDASAGSLAPAAPQRQWWKYLAAAAILLLFIPAGMGILNILAPHPAHLAEKVNHPVANQNDSNDTQAAEVNKRMSPEKNTEDSAFFTNGIATTKSLKADNWADHEAEDFEVDDTYTLTAPTEELEEREQTYDVLDKIELRANAGSPIVEAPKDNPIVLGTITESKDEELTVEELFMRGELGTDKKAEPTKAPELSVVEEPAMTYGYSSTDADMVPEIEVEEEEAEPLTEVVASDFDNNALAVPSASIPKASTLKEEKGRGDDKRDARKSKKSAEKQTGAFAEGKEQTNELNDIAAAYNEEPAVKLEEIQFSQSDLGVSSSNSMLAPSLLSDLGWILGEWESTDMGSAKMLTWIQINDFVYEGLEYDIVEGDTLVSVVFRLEALGQEIKLIQNDISESQISEYILVARETRRLVFEDISSVPPQRISIFENSDGSIETEMDDLYFGNRRNARMNYRRANE